MLVEKWIRRLVMCLAAVFIVAILYKDVSYAEEHVPSGNISGVEWAVTGTQEKGYTLTLSGDEAKIPELFCERDELSQYINSVTELVVKSGITEIGWWAFRNCKALKKATIADGVKSMGGSVFSGCESLEEVDISKSVEKMDGYVFDGCHNLKKVTLPHINTRYNRFYDDIYYEKRVEYVEVIYNTPCDCHPIPVPKDRFCKDGEEYYYVGDNCNRIVSKDKTYVLENGNKIDEGDYEEYGNDIHWETICDGDDEWKLVFSGTGEIPTGFSANNKPEMPYADYKDRIIEVEVKSGISVIGRFAFNQFCSLRKVILAETVENIKEYAFEEVSPESATLPHKFYGQKLFTITPNQIIYNTPCDTPEICGSIKNNKHLASEATCQSPALYYYEGENCHAKQEETYEYGSSLDHKAEEVIISEATCTEAKVCKDVCCYCKIEIEGPHAVGNPLGHKPIASTKYASTKADGAVITKCSVCNKELDTTVIPRAYIVCDETVKYTGKDVKPVKIVTSNGKAISSKFYKVTYKNNKKVGKATATIKFSGDYAGEKKAITKTFNIVKKASIPSKVTGIKVTAAKNTLTVSFKTLKGIDGYELEYSTDKNFLSDVKKVSLKKSVKSKKISIKKADKGKAFYVRIRAYKKDKKTKVYSAWTVFGKAVKAK